MLDITYKISKKISWTVIFYVLIICTITLNILSAKQNHFIFVIVSVCVHVCIIATLLFVLLLYDSCLRFFRYSPITSAELPHFWGFFFYRWRVNQERICSCTPHVQENKCTQQGQNSYISLRAYCIFLASLR